MSTNVEPAITWRVEVVESPPSVMVCECGVIASGWAQARCGRNRVRNISAGCPTRTMQITAWEPREKP